MVLCRRDVDRGGTAPPSSDARGRGRREVGDPRTKDAYRLTAFRPSLDAPNREDPQKVTTMAALTHDQRLDAAYLWADEDTRAVLDAERGRRTRTVVTSSGALAGNVAYLWGDADLRALLDAGM
jgi:hypothetical protein